MMANFYWKIVLFVEPLQKRVVPCRHHMFADIHLQDVRNKNHRHQAWPGCVGAHFEMLAGYFFNSEARHLASFFNSDNTTFSRLVPYALGS